jgi:hypothetical protein
VKNNVITQTGAALCALLAVEADSAGGQSVSKFVAAYGQFAANEIANLDTPGNGGHVVQLSQVVGEQAGKDGWTVSNEFVEAFSASVLFDRQRRAAGCADGRHQHQGRGAGRDPGQHRQQRRNLTRLRAVP